MYNRLIISNIAGAKDNIVALSCIVLRTIQDNATILSYRVVNQLTIKALCMIKCCLNCPVLSYVSADYQVVISLLGQKKDNSKGTSKRSVTV